MQSHDAFIALSGQLAYDSIDEIKEAAKNISFGGDIYIEKVCVTQHESGTDMNLEGEPVEYPAHVMVFFNIGAYNGVDYADDGNAKGLETDLKHKLQANFPWAFVKHVQWKVSVSRPKFCSHPSAYHEETGIGPNACNKCGGPTII